MATAPATGLLTKNYYIAEVTPGVTPTTPAWTYFPITSGQLKPSRESLTSAVLNDTREIGGVYLGQKQVAGEFSVELTLGSHNALLEAALGGAWTTNTGESAVDITIDATAKTWTRAAGDFTTNVSPGDLIRLTTSVNTVNRKVYRAAIVSPLTLTLSDAGTEEMIDEVTTTNYTLADELSIGSTRRTFSILTHYIDADGGLGEYHISRGVEITGFKFSMAVNALVTGSFSMIGRSYSADEALPAGSTFPAVTEKSSFQYVDGRILEAGLQAGLATSMEVTNDNNMSAQTVIGSDTTAFVTQGRANNTLSVSTYFKDSIFLNRFLNGIAMQTVMIAKHPTEGALAFDFPVCTITDAGAEVGGEDSVTETRTMQAIGNPTTPSLKIYSLVV